MAAAIGISSTHGITVPSSAKPQKVDRHRTVGYSEVPGTDGECLLVKPKNMLKTEVAISGKGVWDMAELEPGNIATPADLVLVRPENSEANDDRGTFSVSYAGHSGFTSASNGGSAGGGSPDEHTINVVSVAYSLTKDCRAGGEIDDVVEADADGTPGFRGLVNLRYTFSASGKGDIPANVGPGAGGAKHASITSGASIVTSITDSQEARAVNSWSFDASNWPAATAG